MNFSAFLKKWLPHGFALSILLLIAFIYCFPVFEGKVISQHDVATAKGMQKELIDYNKSTGKYSLWTNSMFGGMPAYQIGGTGAPDNNIFSFFSKIVRFSLPEYSVEIFFLYFLGMYVLGMVLGLSPWLAFLGSIAFGFSSYQVIIIVAGHVNKALAVAIIPIIFAGVITMYKRNYLWGILLTLFGLGLQLRFNHVQMTYYMGMMILIYVLVEFYQHIFQKRIKQFIIASSLILLSMGVSIVPNISNLWLTQDYTKDTQRGVSELRKETKTANKGLDKEYALRWSLGKAESITLLIPNAYGGASGSELSEKGPVFAALLDNGVPRNQAKQLIKQMPTYWGDQPGTSGPVYFGAIICLLFLFSLIIIEKKQRIWIVTAFVITLMLSWGRNWMWFTDLFFDYFPMYNKFRSVTSILVVTSFAVVLAVLLGLKQVFSEGIDRKALLKKLQIAFYIAGGVTAFMWLLGSGFFSFSAEYDSQLVSSGYPAWLIEALVDERRMMFKADAFRSLAFILLGAGSIWLYLQNKLSQTWTLTALITLILVDLWAVDQRYLNADSFTNRKEAREFQPTQADLDILRDIDPNFRVFNLTNDPFNESRTSYFHKSIGGYHAAKLMRYQELISEHIGKNNMQVLNMLNTKYFIVPDQNRQPIAQLNPGALGNAWFVKYLQVVEDAPAEIKALSDFEPSEVAVLDKRFVEKIGNMEKLITDSLDGSSIRLTSYAPDELHYSALAGKDLFAVFSEIYYNSGKGWNAYLDGKRVEHVRVNYVLRGLVVPKGQHEIVFKFEPALFFKSQRFALAGSIISGLIMTGVIIILIRNQKLKSAES